MKITWPYFIVAIIITLYLLVFYLSPNWYENPAIEPYTITPSCSDSGIPLSLTRSDNLICAKDSRILLNIDSSEYEIYSLNEEEILYALTPEAIITTLSNIINISLFSEKGVIQETKQIPLRENEYISSYFYTKSEIYLSTIIEVTSPEEIKSRIFRINISRDDAILKLKEIESEEFNTMYKIAEVDMDILKLEQPFSFLEPYTEYFSWKKASFIREKDLKFTPQISVNIEHNKLAIINQSNKTILEEITSLSNKIRPIGYTSTKNNKTVYNCKDFSESVEITLRTCIPNNETTN